MSEKDGVIFARAYKERLVFLCGACGQLHWHGLGDGHRAAHCTSEITRRLGERPEGYFLYETDHQQGSLSSSEAQDCQRLAQVAYELARNIQRFLDIAAVPPTSEAAIQLAKAEEALSTLAGVRPERLNPFELVVSSDGKEADE